MMYKEKAYRRISGDTVLISVALALVIIGIILLSSASSALAFKKFEDSFYFVKQQAWHLLIGVILFLFFAKVDYHRWRPFAWPLWIVSFVFLVLVFVPGIGDIRNGVRSWLNFGFVNFQPIELVKLLLIIYLATWFADKSSYEIKDMREGMVPFLFSVGLLLMLVLLQPDFGSMILLFAIASIIFFTAGASVKQIIAIATVSVLFIPIMIIFAPYRYERLTAFLHPGENLSSIGYHLNQALIAIGSGGLFGRGLGKSVQKFQYLPEAAGDSIFAIAAEELGFFFSVLLVVLFLILLQRGLKIASRAPDVYGKLLAVGIIGWITVQAFINIGSIIGILPLTGLPLPFISQGGTALVTVLAGIGILYNISKQGIIR